MLTIAKHLLLLFSLSSLLQACKKDIQSEENPVFPVDITLKEGQVTLPAGSTYDLNGHTVITGSVDVPVAKNGKTKVLDGKGKMSIAWLFDRDSKPVMAGFITDSTATISAETTADVILYFSIGIPFQLDTVTHLYLNRKHEIPGLADWRKDFASAWSADPHTFLTGSYVPKLRSWLELRMQKPVAAGLAGSVSVDANDLRSGLRVHPKGLGLAITNSYRRRVTAMFYKMKYQKEGSDQYVNVLSSIGRDTDYDQSMAVDPVSGITSVVGEAWKNLTARGLESAAVTSGPAHFPLLDRETEVVYRARLVAPGSLNPKPITEKEEQELIRLFIVTLAVDFMGPSLGSFFGVLNNHALFNDDILSIMMSDFPKIFPAFFEICLAGNIQKVFLGVMDGLVSEHGYDILVKYMKATYKEVELPKNFEALAKKGAVLLQGIDIALLGGDFLRTFNHASLSQRVEEWEFTIRSSKVSLSPMESAVSIFAPANKQELEATLQNLTAEEMSKVSYLWSVKDKFGTISDGKGKTGASFNSADKKITFTAANVAGLTDGDNWEYVYVTAYLDKQEVGSDTARITVRKTRYEMLPAGVTISGKDGQTNKVNLRLEPVNIGAPIVPNNQTEFKILWETPGSYGSLSVGSQANAKNITTYDLGKVQYECVNDQVKSATETISARIYGKKKGASDLEYRLIDIVKGSVKIVNDDKKKIFRSLWYAPMATPYAQVIP